jgi:hypothetical protein
VPRSLPAPHFRRAATATPNPQSRTLTMRSGRLQQPGPSLRLGSASGDRGQFGWDLKRAGCCGMWGTRIAALRVRLSRRSPRADEMTPARGLEPLAVYIITLFFRCHLHPKPDELAGGVALWLARDVGKQVLIAVFSHQLCVARAHPGRTGI